MNGGQTGLLKRPHFIELSPQIGCFCLITLFDGVFLQGYDDINLKLSFLRNGYFLENETRRSMPPCVSITLIYGEGNRQATLKTLYAWRRLDLLVLY